MTVDEAKEAEIRRLHFAEHWKVGTIVTQLGLHHDVVERVLGLGEGARSRPVVREAEVASEVPRPLRGYETFIAETLAQYPRLRATRLYDMLVERGYEGSTRTVRRHVRLVRPTPKSEAFLRLEPLVAEQAQVDWAYISKLRFAGGTRQLWAFVMVLSYSRAIWAELVLDLSASSLRRSLVRACRFFGGATRQWLFDNPKTVVLARHGDAVRFHPDLLDLAGRLCVAPRLCAVRKPQQKGKVERTIRFLRDRFFAARTIRDVGLGNADLRAFLDEIANVRLHPRWPQRRVDEVLAEEKARLLALPDPLPETDQIEPVPADKTAFVSFDGNRCPDKTTDKTRYAPSFAAHVVVSKCCDSIPLYRLEKQYQRIGIPIARSTMTDLFHRSAEVLSPLVRRLLARIAASDIVLADETSIRMLGTTKRAFLWTFISGRDIGYVFSPDRSGKTPVEVLGGTKGTLLVDAYTGYNKVTVADGRTRAGCLAHVRRKLFEAKDACPEAVAALDIIRDIYVVEHEAKEASIVGTAEHLALRRTRTRPLLAKLFRLLRRQRGRHPPKGPMGKAVRYALNNHRALTRFTAEARIPPDNNRSESALRVVALGRKNFLFVGNEDAGDNIAGLYSLVATCEAYGKNPLAYLTDVLARIGAHPQRQIDELLPDRWHEHRQQDGGPRGPS